MALRRRFGVFSLSCGGCAAGQVAFGEQGDFRGVVHETVDGARSDAIEIRDAGFVDRTLQSVSVPWAAAVIVTA